MIAYQRHGGGPPVVGGAANVEAGEVLRVADADQGQAVLQGLIVEAHPILAGDRGQDVTTGQFGHPILVGVTIVLAPVPLDVEFEALVCLTIEGDQSLPLVVGDQSHGKGSPGIGSASEIQGGQHAGVGAVVVGDGHGSAGTGGQPFGIGHGDRHGMGTRGIEPDRLGGGGAAAGPAVVHHAPVVAGGGGIEHHALTRLDAEGLGGEGGHRCLVASEGGDRVTQIAFVQGDAIGARSADQNVLAAALVGDAIPFVVAVVFGPVAEDVELEALGAGGVTIAGQGEGG